MSFRSTFTVIRRAAGNYVDGIWVEGDPTEMEIKASAQPLRPEQVNLLPEGRRTDQAFKIYTDTELLVASSEDAQNSDLIVIESENFEIIAVAPFKSDVINHYRAIAVKPVP